LRKRKDRAKAEVTEMPSRTGVSLKISKLRREGTPQRQAVAEALSMQRAGRLTASGGYRRVGKKRRI
jgi:hypothetical protein